MNIAICDDAQTDRLLLSRMVQRYAQSHFFELEAEEYESGEALLGEFCMGRFHILFLDVFMKGMDGLEVARRVREVDKKSIIIFSTSSPNYAVEGFAVHAAGYLLKPFQYEQLEEVLDWCGGNIAEAMRYVDVLSNRILRRVFLKDILYVEVCNRVCKIHMHSEVITTYRTLSEMAQSLDSPAFLRCHRSFIVNMGYIQKVMDFDFQLVGGDLVPISIDEKVRVKQSYYDYSAQKQLHAGAYHAPG